MRRRLLSFATFLGVALSTNVALAAEDELPSGNEPPRIVPIAVADAYYAWHDTPPARREATLMTTGVRHGEFAINLAAIGMRLEHAKILGTLVLQAGSSVDALYPPSNQGAFSGPEVWKHIQVASAGYRFGDLTLEAGVFPSHIGYESFVSTSNWNYTRAMVSELTPYYLGGVRATYRVLPNLSAMLSVFNGWKQAIGDNNKYKSFGGKVEWKLFDWLTLSDALYAGPEAGQEGRDWRLFDDLVVQLKPHARVSVVAEIWYGTDRATDSALQKAAYHGAALFAKWQFGETTYVAVRGEAVEDTDGVLTGRQARPLIDPNTLQQTPPGQKMFGGTLTLGWQPHPNFLARVEALYRGSDEFFFAGGSDDSAAGARKNSTTFVANVAFAY